MKIVWKIIVGFLAFVGAATLAAAAYVYVADPFGIKTVLSPQSFAPPATSNVEALPPGQYNLSEAQIYTLEKMGVDVSQLPDTIPLELEECLVNTIGQNRTLELKAGAVPTPADFLKAKPCLSN